MPEVRGSQITASYVASGNLPQWRLVNFLGPDVYLPATSGSIVLGVTQNHPNDGEAATIVTLGHTKVLVANSLGAGTAIMTGLNGFAVQATSGQWVAGYITTAANSGTPAEAVITPFRVFGGNP